MNISVIPPDEPLSLWYRQPAKQWLEALPIGNGRLGAMVYGGVDAEILQLNEDTLWGGGPHDYTNPEALAVLPEARRLIFEEKWQEAHKLLDQSFVGRPVCQMPYQTVGEFHLVFPGLLTFDSYRRELNIKTAIALTEFTIDGVRYTREVFATAPDNVIVVRLSADRPGSISFAATWTSPQKTTVNSLSDTTLALDGISGDAFGIEGKVRFQALAHLQNEGGTVTSENEQIAVHGADKVTLFISIATSYRNYTDADGDAGARASEYLEKAVQKTYDELKQAHIADYQELFNRVTLDLGTTDAAILPTDERVTAFKTGDDPQLAALQFQYGRYLLIASSRPGTQPANLQGIWNRDLNPPWGSKYTININTEMNYWPAAQGNLLECYEPLFQMISEIRETGTKTAQVQYGARGWVAHHNTDGWRGTSPVDGVFWGMWPMGGAWLCKSFWDYYEYTGDRKTLDRYYPLMRDAALFFLDTLVEEPEHRYLVTCPSVSPENAHHPGVSLCAGPTMDMQILRDLFTAVIRASEILQIDNELRGEFSAIRQRLAPMQIGKAGQLQEWLEDWDMEVEEIHHRHVSHLYGLYPSNQITRKETPELFEAARRTLEIRGDEATGWSMGWKINFWARLEDGDHAFKLVSDLLTPERTAPNLFDLHPPFQIDGNFGYTSGVAEMLVQSHYPTKNEIYEIALLPALPSVWPAGSVKGLLVRGNVTVDITWKEGRLVTATLLAGHSGTLRVRTPETISVLQGDQPVPVTRDGEDTFAFEVVANSGYTVISIAKTM